VTDALAARHAEETSILKILAYFDIFQYPLTKNEIIQFLPGSFADTNIDEVLQLLLSKKAIFLHSDFYSLHNNPLLAYRRQQGNIRAQKLMPKGFAIGRFLFRFPFVRAIGISGSLSKNFADEKADIDFFIIVKANRLWIARTIMHVFKKFTFISGHQHYFCMNYYIDEEALLIEDQNIFTAIEIKTLVPVCGEKVLSNFFSVNNWTYKFVSSVDTFQLQHATTAKAWYKGIVEWMFSNRLGDHLDKWLEKITTRRWLQKSLKGKRNKNGHTMNLVTGRHFSRSNPGAFQEKVLALYKQKLIDLKLL